MIGRGLIISLEGISGAGKTYYAQQLPDAIADRPISVLDELSDRSGISLESHILSALRTTGDQFLRSNMPQTITLLLCALKTYDFENLVDRRVSDGEIVVEDRSLDTIAVYQSLLDSLVCGGNQLAAAVQLFESLASWRPAPDLSVLLRADVNLAISRAEKRQGRPYSGDDRHLLESAAALYADYADFYQERFVIVDVDSLDDDQVISTIVDSVGRRLR